MKHLVHRAGGRRRLPRAGIALALGAVAALVLSACGGGGSTTPSGGADGRADQLVIGMGGPSSLDPSGASFNVPGYYINFAYDSLIHWTNDDKMEPGLATEWKYTDEANKVFELTIRSGVKFADGEDLTAQAVADSINYFKTGTGPTAGSYTQLTAAATGDLQVTVTSEVSNPNMEQLFSQFYLGGDIIAPEGLKDPSKLTSQSFGAGPYTLDPSQTVASDHYTYVANDSYWDQSAIHFDKVVIKVYDDENAGLAAVQTGAVDIYTGGSSTTIDAAKAAGLNVMGGTAYWNGLQLIDQQGKIVPALADQRVRQALSYAIDRATVAAAVLGSDSVPLEQPALPGQVGYEESLNSTYPYDLAKAKSLLAEAGYANGFTIPVTVLSGTWLERLMQAVDGQLQQIGVSLQFVPASNIGEFLGNLSSGKVAAFDIPISTTSLYSTYGQNWKENANLNGTNEVDAQLKSLVDTAAATPTADAEPAWKAVNEYLVDQAYTIPVAASFQYYYLATDIQGAALNPSTALMDPLLLTKGS